MSRATQTQNKAVTPDATGIQPGRVAYDAKPAKPEPNKVSSKGLSPPKRGRSKPNTAPQRSKLLVMLLWFLVSIWGAFSLVISIAALDEFRHRDAEERLLAMGICCFVWFAVILQCIAAIAASSEASNK